MSTELEYEQALLGAVLHGYRDIPALARVVSRGDFYRPGHQDIWQAVTALHADGITPNPLTVLDWMGKTAHSLPGGAGYLAGLDAPIGSDPLWLAQKVRDAEIRRDIDLLGNRCHQMLEDVDTPVEDLVAKIRTWADGITMTSSSTTVSVQSALEKVIDIAEHGLPDGSQSPWPSLDELTGGWYPGQLITFGAATGVGKSIALENVATYTARREKCWVLLVSMEMSEAEITLRTMAYTASVELTKLRKGTLNEQEWSRVNNASGIIADTRMRFGVEPSYTVAEIRAAAWEVSQEAKRVGERLGMVVVDYVQQVQYAGPKDRTRQQELGAITRVLKQVARELEVPVVTAAQFNRAAGVPTLAHLRESADIANDSDVVILMHEETVEEAGRLILTGDVHMDVAKNRNGPLGRRTLKKYGHYSRLHDDQGDPR